MRGSKSASAWHAKYVSEIIVHEEVTERSSGCIQDMSAREKKKKEKEMEEENERKRKGRKNPEKQHRRLSR